MWGANGALTINPGLQSKLSYDPLRDFAPISLVLRMSSIIAVNNDLPALPPVDPKGINPLPWSVLSSTSAGGDA